MNVGVNDNLGKHFGVIAVPSTARISRVEDGVVETVNGGVYYADEMILGGVVLERYFVSRASRAKGLYLVMERERLPLKWICPTFTSSFKDNPFQEQPEPDTSPES